MRYKSCGRTAVVANRENLRVRRVVDELLSGARALNILSTAFLRVSESTAFGSGATHGGWLTPPQPPLNQPFGPYHSTSQILDGGPRGRWRKRAKFADTSYTVARYHDFSSSPRASRVSLDIVIIVVIITILSHVVNILTADTTQ